MKQAQQPDATERAFASALSHLSLFEGVQRIRRLEGQRTALVEYQKRIGETPRQTFIVWDNGGELGVELVNSGELPRFVPTAQDTVEVNAGTVALWAHSLLEGSEPDFSDSMPDLTTCELSRARSCRG